MNVGHLIQMGGLQSFSMERSKTSSNFYGEGAIVLHCQMRIFLVLGISYPPVKKGKKMRCEGLFHSILASP